MAELELRSLSKQFGDVRILEDISLRVPDGSFTILLGPSGCGKSTILRIIAGLEAQTDGQVLIGGQLVDGLSPKDRDIAMVFQQYALYPHLTVRQNLAFGLTIRGESRQVIDQRIKDAASLLEIETLLDRKPKELSGGQRQRVAMGRAIVRKPKLFLFDEPLSNLDARLRSSMRIELKQLHERLGATMIYVTHDQVEAMTLGDTIVVMDRGHIKQIDPPGRIYATPADPFVAGFIGTPSMNLWEGELRQQGTTWRFVRKGLEVVVPAVQGAHPSAPVQQTVLGIRPEDVSLTPLDRPATQLDARVDVVENLGSDLVLHLTAGDERIVVRARGGDIYVPGKTVTLLLPHEKLHLFFDNRRADWDL